MIFLLSFYFGLGAFFSFAVTPVLFKVLEKSAAGAVVERIFPLYFGIGLGSVGAVFLMALSSRLGKFLLTLLTVNLIVLSLEFFYILPTIGDLKATGSPEFSKYHLYSVILGTVSLFFTFGAIVYLIVKRTDDRAKA